MLASFFGENDPIWCWDEFFERVLAKFVSHILKNRKLAKYRKSSLLEAADFKAPTINKHL